MKQKDKESESQISTANLKFKKAVYKTIELSSLEKCATKKISDGFLNLESTDGQLRYKIGLIDFLTKYSAIKYIENEYKAFRHGVDNSEVSAIDQERYQNRFNHFMEKYL